MLGILGLMFWVVMMNLSVMVKNIEQVDCKDVNRFSAVLLVEPLDTEQLRDFLGFMIDGIIIIEPKLLDGKNEQKKE